MQVLIVESRAELGRLWARHIERMGHSVILATNQAEAIDVLHGAAVHVIVLDLFLDDGSALAVADFASYRRPNAKVVFVTNSTFFSDGSIFTHAPNACAFLQSEMRPDDLATMVSHYGESAVTATSKVPATAH